jgi:hypothetical protein
VAPTPVPNFRAAWEALPEEAEMADDYGLGQVHCCCCCCCCCCWCNDPLLAGDTACCCCVQRPPEVSYHLTANRYLNVQQAVAHSPGGAHLTCPPDDNDMTTVLPSQRAGLEEAVEAVLTTLGMAPCEGTDAVPPNAR